MYDLILETSIKKHKEKQYNKDKVTAHRSTRRLTDAVVLGSFGQEFGIVDPLRA